MSLHNPCRRVQATIFVVLASLTACNLPRAKLANLREVHQPDGQLSYVGNVRSDIEFALSAALANSPVRIQGLDGLSATEEAIEDPCGIDLENLNDLAAADSDDIFVSGLQVEAFGWLGPDDQYVLGRERAVIELGRAAVRLGLDGPQGAPEAPATPEEISPKLADLARAGLGSLPAELENGELALAVRQEGNLTQAIAGVRELTFDRAGALRGLAVCDVLFLRVGGLRKGDSTEAKELRALALELQAKIVSMALGEALGDASPIIRATAFEALAGVSDGAAIGLLKLGATDPDPEVAARSMLFLARHGLPLERIPAGERAAKQAEWVAFLVGQAQTPDPRSSFAACSALVEVAGAGLDSLRPEDWTAWWRAEHPDQDLPRPLVASGAGDSGS